MQSFRCCQNLAIISQKSSVIIYNNSKKNMCNLARRFKGLVNGTKMHRLTLLLSKKNFNCKLKTRKRGQRSNDPFNETLV